MIYRYGPSWGNPHTRHGYQYSQELLDRLTPGAPEDPAADSTPGARVQIRRATTLTEGRYINGAIHFLRHGAVHFLVLLSFGHYRHDKACQ